MSETTPRDDRFGFPPTRWELVREAAESETARNELLSLYFQPILAYFRALVRDDAVARELRQSFLAAELERLGAETARGVVRRANPDKGRFRDYLKQSLRHHWLSGLRRQTEAALPQHGDDWHPTIADAEREFVRAWLRQVLVVALRVVEQACREKGQEQHFAIFVGFYLPTGAADVSWEDLARQHGLKDGRTARTRAMTVRDHLRASLVDLLAREHPKARLENEIGEFLSILGDNDA